MVKTVPFDIIANFMVGMLVALACGEGVRSVKSMFVNRYLLGVVLFETFFFLPLGAYLYFFYWDWSLMFFIDPASLGPETRQILGGAALAGYMAAIVGGFLTAAGLIRKDRAGTAVVIFLVVAAALGIFSAFTIKRLTGVGAYADWTAAPRTTVPLYLHRIGYIVGIYATVATAALLLTIKDLSRDEGGGQAAWRMKRPKDFRQRGGCG